MEELLRYFTDWNAPTQPMWWCIDEGPIHAASTPALPVFRSSRSFICVWRLVKTALINCLFGPCLKVCTDDKAWICLEQCVPDVDLAAVANVSGGKIAVGQLQTFVK